MNYLTISEREIDKRLSVLFYPERSLKRFTGLSYNDLRDEYFPKLRLGQFEDEFQEFYQEMFEQRYKMTPTFLDYFVDNFLLKAVILKIAHEHGEILK